jgi:hypothetical protein
MGSLFILILAVLIKIYVVSKNPVKSESYGRQLDFVVLFSGTAVLFLAALSIISGFLIMPIRAMLNSGIIKNKITVGILMFILVTAFMGIRYFYRETIHNKKGLYLFSSFLAVAAFGLGIVASSIGGELTNRSSGFEKIAKFFFLETRWTFYLPTIILVIIALFAFASLILGLMYKKRSE